MIRDAYEYPAQNRAAVELGDEGVDGCNLVPSGIGLLATGENPVANPIKPDSPGADYP